MEVTIGKVLFMPAQERVEEPKKDFSWKVTEKIVAADDPAKNVIRYRAQSLMNLDYPLSYEQSLDIVRWAERTPIK